MNDQRQKQPRSDQNTRPRRQKNRTEPAERRRRNRTNEIERGQQRSFRQYQPPLCLNLSRCPRARGRVQSANPHGDISANAACAQSGASRLSAHSRWSPESAGKNSLIISCSPSPDATRIMPTDLGHRRSHQRIPAAPLTDAPTHRTSDERARAAQPQTKGWFSGKSSYP